jgi:hypothetical protein
MHPNPNREIEIKFTELHPRRNFFEELLIDDKVKEILPEHI